MVKVHTMFNKTGKDRINDSNITACYSHDTVNMAGFEVCIKWGGKEYNVTGLLDTQTVLDLKTAIQTETGVRPDRQKLLGLKVKGKLCISLGRC